MRSRWLQAEVVSQCANATHQPWSSAWFNNLFESQYIYFFILTLKGTQFEAKREVDFVLGLKVANKIVLLHWVCFASLFCLGD